MKQLKAFVRKEFIHIFRDPRSMLILFLMPVVQLLIFGYVVNNDIKNAKIAIIDQSKDQATRQIISDIQASGYFEIRSEITSVSQIETSFKSGAIKLALVFEPDFEKNRLRGEKSGVQIIADASDANTARLLTNYCSAIIARYSISSMPEGRSMAGVSIIPRMFFNEEMEGVFMSVPGLMAMILMLISAMMTSISITREKEFGSMEVLLISPLKPWQIIVGKVIPYFLMAIINSISIIVISVLIFHMPVVGSWVLLIFTCMLFTLLALSLGIFISTIAENQMVAMFISMFGLMLPTILLSGFIYPIENMPWILQVVSNLIPPRWFIIIIKKVMLQGAGLQFIWKELLILSAFVVVFLVLSIKKFKVRLE